MPSSRSFAQTCAGARSQYSGERNNVRTSRRSVSLNAFAGIGRGAGGPNTGGGGRRGWGARGLPPRAPEPLAPPPGPIELNLLRAALRASSLGRQALTDRDIASLAPLRQMRA